MEINDRRTPEELKSHPLLVVGTDPFMSGWGNAQGGSSYAAWACRIEDVDRVERWVMDRGEMKRVRVVSADYRPKPGYCAHLSIYVVNDGHASLS